MQIIQYDGTQEEQTRISEENKVNGFILTHVSNVVEGNFLGFVHYDVLNAAKEEGREEIRKIVREAADLPEMNQEARTHLVNNGVIPKP